MKFEALKEDYESLWARMELKPSMQKSVDYGAAKVLAGRARHRQRQRGKTRRRAPVGAFLAAVGQRGMEDRCHQTIAARGALCETVEVSRLV